MISVRSLENGLTRALQELYSLYVRVHARLTTDILILMHRNRTNKTVSWMSK